MELVKFCVVIKETYNNVFITLTNLNGDVIYKVSQGLFVKQGIKFKHSKPFFYSSMLRSIAFEIYKLGIYQVGLNKFIFRRFIILNIVNFFVFDYDLKFTYSDRFLGWWFDDDDDDDDFSDYTTSEFKLDIFKFMLYFFYKIFYLFLWYFEINIILRLNGIFSRRLKYFFSSLGSLEHINIFIYDDFLPIAHNGCRGKKLRRL